MTDPDLILAHQQIARLEAVVFAQEREIELLESTLDAVQTTLNEVIHERYPDQLSLR